MFKNYINGKEVSKQQFTRRRIVEQNIGKFILLLAGGYIRKGLDKLWYTISSNRLSLLIGAIIIGLTLFGWAKIYAYTDEVTAYGGKKLVTVYGKQVKEMINRGYSKTKILDLLTLRTMECNRYDGLCYGLGNKDLGFFQINYIHKEQYKHSLSLMKQRKSGELFLYQLDYASQLYDYYQKHYCGEHIYNLIGRTYTNERHFKCIAKSYNGSPRYKYTYANIGWLKRAKVKEYLNNNY